MDSTSPPRAPYPPDVRAKGWRFEIDYEKVDQSDTWNLASESTMAQPALLMMWLVAWTQVPCGSMPNDENLIRVRCRIPEKLWPALRPVLMRGWWLADDGRLYHNTIAQRVLEMMEYRKKETDRRNRNRERPTSVPRLSRGTTAGHTRDSGGAPDTGTGTGTNKNTPLPPDGEMPVGVDSGKDTKAGAVCKAIRAKGVVGVNPSSPELLAFIAKGVSIETFEAAAEICGRSVPPKGLQYLLTIVRRQVDSAAAIAAGPSMSASAWDATRQSIEAKGIELGIKPWNEGDLSVSRETFAAYTARVRRAVDGVPA